MVKEFVFALIGGLGFFFFGIQIMSEGMKKIAGERLKKILHMATKIPIVGILAGTAVTAIIQSSSATTVMVVGFVNAGLLALRQAISVIMGANIGTTFTAWIVSSMGVLDITHYALPAVGIGFAFMKLGRTKNAKFWGQVLMGFGILFIGLNFMKDAVIPLKQSPYVKDMFVSFSDNPLMGVLVGVIFTILLQSSSVTIAILQVLAFSGLITFPQAIPIILGDNIGTTITAQMASFGANLAARRAAMAHTLFNVAGVVYMLFFVYIGWYAKVIDFIIPGEITVKNIMFYIAIAHSFFNIVNTLVFLPAIGLLEKWVIWLVPKRKGMVEMGAKYLERHLLETPTIAIEQAKKETVRMLELAKSSVSAGVKSFIENDRNAEKLIPNLEQAVDTLQSEITQYLVELSQKNLQQEESEELPVLIHSVNDIERIGDHAENIKELAERKREEKLPFTDEAIGELKSMWMEVSNMAQEAKQALEDNNVQLAKDALKREEKINEFQKRLKQTHVERLNQGKCNIKSGVIFLDFVDNLEKIGDHLTNIAQGVVGEMRWRPKTELKSGFN